MISKACLKYYLITGSFAAISITPGSVKPCSCGFYPLRIFNFFRLHFMTYGGYAMGIRPLSTVI